MENNLKDLSQNTLRELIIKIYQGIYKEVTPNKKYIFVLNPKDEKTLEKFEKYLNSKSKAGIGFAFLIDYFLFQFNYWLDKETRFGKGRVFFPWTIGEKAIKRWDNKSIQHYKYFVYKNLKTKIEIDLRKIFSVEKPDIYSKLEESDKARFYNTIEGFVWCLNTTSLFFPESAKCQNCIFKKDCKAELKTNYPPLYKKRLNE